MVLEMYNFVPYIAFTGWAPGQLYQKRTLLTGILPNMTLCTHMVMIEVSTLGLQETEMLTSEVRLTYGLRLRLTFNFDGNEEVRE